MASVCGAIPPSFSQNQSTDNTAALLSRWEPDLRRAARARLYSFDLPLDYGADLEQEGRLSLVLAARRYHEPTEQLMRTVLANSVLKASARESRRCRRTVEIEAAETVADESQHESSDPGLVRRTKRAIVTLPAPLKQLFGLLYVEGISQREAASRLRLSQPRVSKLHAQLKQRLKAILDNAA